LKKVLATLLGLFGASRSDSAPGELRPPSSSLRPHAYGSCRRHGARGTMSITPGPV